MRYLSGIRFAVVGVACLVLTACGSTGGLIPTTPAPVPERSILSGLCNSSNVVYSPTQPLVEPQILDTIYKIQRYQGTVHEGFDCNDWRSTINSDTFKAQKIIGGGPHTMYQYVPAVPESVFTSSVGLHLAADIVIPEGYGNPETMIPFFPTYAEGNAQVCFYLYFRNTATGDLIAYVIEVFDSHPIIPEAILSDTVVSFVSTRLLPNTKYASLSPNSATSTNEPGQEFQHYDVRITPDNFKLGVQDINTKFVKQYSIEPTDWKLTSISVGAEITNTPVGRSYISFAVKNLAVTTTSGVLK